MKTSPRLGDIDTNWQVCYHGRVMIIRVADEISGNELRGAGSGLANHGVGFASTRPSEKSFSGRRWLHH